MISLGSRDGRKRLGLGLGFGVGREMEETELEEGEACSYQDNDDASIDPDIALSYIDEKLHSVLGHFQKDFEGGVSAENLGAKFGGYGSFLPTYQRSPVWSHPRTPPKVQNFNTPISPNSSQLEGGHHNPVGPSSAPLLMRHGPTSTSVAALPASKASSVHDSVKRDLCRPSTHAEELTSTFEIANKSLNPPDQKTLKVRIKVGSDNLSTQKNAAIYSGLGLDVSPSSSLDDSPTESEGLSREPQDAPDESPTSILRIMTSFPVLLSPLPDDLLRLIKKEKLLRDGRSGPVPKIGQGSSVMLVNGSDSVRGDGNVLGEKKPRAVEKNGFSVESKNGNSKDAWGGTGVILKKEVDDTLACEELVSNALKLPLLSNPYSTVGDSAKGTGLAPDISREAIKGVVKDKLFSDIAKEEPLEPISTQEVGWVEKSNGKAVSAGKVSEDKKENSVNDISVYPRKDGNRKGEKSYESNKADSNAFKVRKALNTELADPLKQKTEHKAASHEQNGIQLSLGKDYSSSGGKKKSKGSQSHDTRAAEVPKENLGVGSSSVPKNKKSTPAENHVSNSELENLKSQKDSGKVRDRYRDLFGDMKLEQEEDKVDSLEMPSEGRLKESELVEKTTFAFNNTLKGRPSGKKIDKPMTVEAYPKVASNGAPLIGNGPISDAAPATVAPVVIEENWVCCDKCQTWRLLPIGTNPDNLPEKWLCSMLNWLPGMNRCNFSEEETTKALIALYQVPASEGQNNLQNHPDGIVSGLTRG
ncbi:hypothetical protein L1049_003703 [Liquidambar formosana]|uniref:CW-type domain-containing protein n=1 Tax=Liquidambar formosana TaxID=63359 RepID=A0AAP0RMC0_LIQFO